MKIFSFVKNVACSLLLSASLLCLLSCGRGKDSTAIAPNGWDDDTEANSVLNVALPGGKTLEMIKVKRGSFQIVAPFAVQKTFESRDWYPGVRSEEATLQKAFWLGKYEVTQEQWGAVMKGEKSADGSDLTSFLKYGFEKHPVVWITWDEVKMFCNKLNDLYAGKLPEGYYFDVPTVDQWEYACRAGTPKSTYWGDDSIKPGMTNIIDANAQFITVGQFGKMLMGGNFIPREKRTNKVGSFPPNPWGFYDMFGNVWEMCESDHDNTTQDPASDEDYDPITKGYSFYVPCEDVDVSFNFLLSQCVGYKHTGSKAARSSIEAGFRLALVSPQSIIHKTRSEQKAISDPTFSMNLSESDSDSKVLSFLPGVTMRLKKIKAGKSIQTGAGTTSETKEKDAALSSKNLKSKLNGMVQEWIGEQDLPNVLSRLPFDAGIGITSSENDDEKSLVTAQGLPVPASDYWIAETEVSQEQWMAVMGNNPSCDSFQDPRLPVTSVSYYEAMDFCKQLNQKLQLPKEFEFTLPTSGQWEYACRAGTTTDYNNEKNMNIDVVTTKMYKDQGLLVPSPGMDEYLMKIAWYGIYRYPRPVGKKRANAWGLYDMHGNVSEWVKNDEYDDKHVSQEVKTESISSVDQKLRFPGVRGGNYQSPPHECFSGFETRMDPQTKKDEIGFRIVLVHTQDKE